MDEKKFYELSMTQIIDKMDDAIDDDYDGLYDAMEKKEFFKYLQEQIAENTKQIAAFNEQSQKISERLDKIDNFWNIANKLEMILDRVRKPAYKSHQKKV